MQKSPTPTVGVTRKVKVEAITAPSMRVRTQAHDPEALAASLAEIGLINSITLNEGHRLITGYHRLQASKKLGWVDIEARVLKLDGLDTELLEIDENLRRYDLTAWGVQHLFGLAEWLEVQDR